MKSIFEQIQNNFVSLLNASLSSCQIALQLCPSRATMNKVCAGARPDMQKGVGGRPVRFTAADKRRLVWMVTIEEADTAVQLARELRDSIQVKLSSKAVCRALK